MNLREGMQAFFAGMKPSDPREQEIEIYRAFIDRFLELCEPVAEVAEHVEHASLITTPEGRAIAITVPCARFRDIGNHCAVVRAYLNSGEGA